MRDARMAELALLSDLEVADKRLQFTSGLPAEELYGLSVSAFKEMLMYLVMEGLINGDAKFVQHGIVQGSIGAAQELYLSQDIIAIHNQYALHATINHRGRLRLQQLREELRSSRTREPFGLLYSEEYRERDLEVAFAFLPPNQPLSVIFLDLDNFKQVNDTKSHSVGDIVMKRYLQIVHDLTERFGEAYRGRGDELTVILPQADAARALGIAEAIRVKIESEFKAMPEIAELAKKPTASIGVTTCVTPARPADVFAFVDKLMYEAKNGGKNKCVPRLYGTVPLVTR